MDKELRDAVVKLEVQVEHMSTVIKQLAASMERLADIKSDLREHKTELANMHTQYIENEAKMNHALSELKKDIKAIADKQRDLEFQSSKNTWFSSNLSKVMWIAGAAFLGAFIKSKGLL